MPAERIPLAGFLLGGRERKKVRRSEGEKLGGLIDGIQRGWEAGRLGCREAEKLESMGAGKQGRPIFGRG